jgi:hypothetical protein
MGLDGWDTGLVAMIGMAIDAKRLVEKGFEAG